MDKEKFIIDSWKENAKNWITLLENDGIESRKLATNGAIVDAVCNTKPVSVLDIGCGEGWLSKELSAKGIEVTGIDVIPELINKAREKVRGEFMVASYEDISLGNIRFSKLFDVIVINFALIGKESAENLVSALPLYLAAEGKLIIQTLHPFSRKISGDYTSGWKEGSWDGLSGQFIKPYQWYFRTMEDWLKILGDAGFSKIKCTDILHPATAVPISVIFECNAASLIRLQ